MNVVVHYSMGSRDVNYQPSYHSEYVLIEFEAYLKAQRIHIS